MPARGARKFLRHMAVGGRRAHLRAEGDLYRAGSVCVVRLHGGLLNGTAPVVSSNVTAPTMNLTLQPNARCSNDVAQSIPASALTGLNWNTETFDVGGVHSTAAAPSRFTVPAGSSGLWSVTVSAGLIASSAARYVVELSKNGTAIQRGTDVALTANTGNLVIISASALLRLNVADYVEGFVFHDNTGAINTSTSAALHSMAAAKLY
jgi:hypothetical protein